MSHQKKKLHIEYLKNHIILLTNRVEDLENLKECFSPKAFNYMVKPKIKAYYERIFSIQNRIINLYNL